MDYVMNDRELHLSFISMYLFAKLSTALLSFLF